MNMIAVPQEDTAAPAVPEFSDAVSALEAESTPVVAPVDDDFPDPDAYYAQKEREHWDSLAAQEAEAEEQEWFEQHDETHLPSEFEDEATSVGDAKPKPVNAVTLTAYPFVALHLAGRDALAALWEHYTTALLANTVRSQEDTTTAQRAGEMAAALIVFCYQEEIARLEKAIGVDSDASVNALFVAHTQHPMPSLAQIVQDLSGSRSLQADVYRAEVDQYIVDPLQPTVTAEHYLSGHYGRLQREGRCKVYQVENGVKRQIEHITRESLNGEWYAHLKGVKAPVRLLTHEALSVELLPTEAPAAPVTPEPSVTLPKYDPSHVALRLRNEIHGRLRLGRVERVVCRRQRIFEVEFAHPIIESVRAQLSAAFTIALNANPKRVLVEVPPAWLGLPETEAARVCGEIPVVPVLPETVTRLTVPVSITDWRTLCGQAADALEGKGSISPNDRQVLITRLRAASVEVDDATA